MSTLSFEDAVEQVRKKFRPVDLSQVKGPRPTPKRVDVEEALRQIDDVSRRPEDKIRIATRLKTDANDKFSQVGTTEEDQHLTGLPLANAKREQQYIVDVYAAALDQLSRK